MTCQQSCGWLCSLISSHGIFLRYPAPFRWAKSVEDDTNRCHCSNPKPRRVAVGFFLRCVAVGRCCVLLLLLLLTRGEFLIISSARSSTRLILFDDDDDAVVVADGTDCCAMMGFMEVVLVFVVMLCWCGE